jgi:hypothetical protein
MAGLWHHVLSPVVAVVILMNLIKATNLCKSRHYQQVSVIPSDSARFSQMAGRVSLLCHVLSPVVTYQHSCDSDETHQGYQPL